MSIIAWIILGLISGFIASKIVNKTGEGVFLDIVLGIVARSRRISFPIGGINWRNWLQRMEHVRRNYWAIVVLFIKHAIMGRRGPHIDFPSPSSA